MEILNITQTDKTVTAYPVYNLNLEETLNCGQCFRWENLGNNSFFGVVKNKAVTVCMTDNKLSITPCTKDDFYAIWEEYFDLKTDYKEIQKSLSKISPVLKEAITYAPGIRILNQDFWEAICSFIISQNNNIKRITGIIKRLCESFGTEISKGVYTFPSAKTLASKTVEDLAPLRSGFRAKYIIDAAQKINDGTVCLSRVLTAPLKDAKEELMLIKGIGTKVADCALLYGFHRLECFPMDIWMKRAMNELFPKNKPSDFGNYAGIAQQYIFHYSRMHPELFSDKNKN